MRVSRLVVCAALAALVFLAAAPLAADRPTHLPQTVGLQFLQGLQLRDLDYAKERVLPAQQAQVALASTLGDLGGWVPTALERGDFPLLSLDASGEAWLASYAVPGRGTVSFELRLAGSEWRVDVSTLRYSDPARVMPPAGLKVSQARPLERARTFLEAFTRLDLVQAASLGTESTKRAVMALEPVLGLVERPASGAAGEIKMMSEKVTGDTAVVEYRIGARPSKPLNLVKVGGNWLVDLAPGQGLP